MMNLIRIIVLSFMLSACSVFELQNATSVSLLAAQAINQYPIVEQRLREDTGLFTSWEKNRLNSTARQVVLLRDSMQQVYDADGFNSLVAGGDLLVGYQDLRLLYKEAIEIVEDKLVYMDVVAAMDVGWHIKTVRKLDREVQKLLAADQDRQEALKATIDVLTVVAKIALAAGA